MTEESVKVLRDVQIQMNAVKKDMSDFTDQRHSQALESDQAAENAICEVTETSDSRTTELESAICELSETVASLTKSTT